LADEEVVSAKRLKLRRPDSCTRCETQLPAGVIAVWDRESQTVTCIPCLEGPPAPADVDAHPSPVDNDRPGASLAREYERRRSNRERRVRAAHPHIGGLLLAWNGEPQHQRAFRLGEQGEIDVAASIEQAVAKVAGVALHNRRLPGGRGDIDHIAIVPSGIYVIDTKAVTGKVEIRSRWFKPPRLFIGGRDRTKYLDGLDRQVTAVRNALQSTEYGSAPVQAVLCFTQADLPLLRPA
jgi:nuclease-like protein